MDWDRMKELEVPYSRLFVLCSRKTTEDELSELFKEFGNIRQVNKVTDKRTGQEKGVAFVRFSKTSEAALAMENMNGYMAPGTTRPLVVTLAAGKNSDQDEVQPLKRIFMKVPKTYSKDDLKAKFEEFGDITNCAVLKDKNTGENRGLAFVTFQRPFSAARAVEESDPGFRVVFATENKASEKNHPDMGSGGSYNSGNYGPGNYGSGNYGSNNYGSGNYGSSNYGSGNYGPGTGGSYGSGSYGSGGNSFGSGMPSLARGGAMTGTGRNAGSGGLLGMGNTNRAGNYQDYSAAPPQPQGDTQLEVHVSSLCTYSELYQLFDILPGLIGMESTPRSGYYHVEYDSALSANRARDKIDGIEFMGCQLNVRFLSEVTPAFGGGSGDILRGAATSVEQALGQLASTGNAGGNLQSLVDTLQKAASVLQHADLGSGMAGSSGPPVQGRGGPVDGMERVRYSNISLPYPQPILPVGTPVAKRLFIYYKGDHIPETILVDAFSRFGDLIHLHVVQGRKFGFAKYGKTESADRALETLDQQVINGQFLGVKVAEDKPDNGDDGPDRKKPRI